MMNKRKIAAYLGFDALKGLNESINQENKKSNKIKRPQLSEDELNEMDLILLRCYRMKKEIIIKYFHKGKILKHIGFIDRINLIDKSIITTNNKKIDFVSILGLEENNGWD